MRDPVLRMTYGHAGWVRWIFESNTAFVLMRFEDIDGRLEPFEEYVRRTDGRPLSTADMTKIPRARLVDLANDPLHAARIRERMGFCGIDMTTVSHYVSSNFGDGSANHLLAPGGRAQRSRDHWVTQMFRQQMMDDPPPQPSVPAVSTAPILAEFAPIDATLEIPESKRWPDEFYRQVEDLARRIKAQGDSPARVIAQANNVPASRVRQWRMTAKDRALGRTRGNR